MKSPFERLLYMPLVECEKLPAIVLEVVGMPCRGLFLDFQKEPDKT
jgi:hypothetical protein